MKKKQRPHDTYTPEAFEEVCRLIECGHGLHRAVEGVGDCGSVTTFLRWMHKTPENEERYTRAREIRAMLMEDEMLQIADDGRNDTQVDETGIPIVNYDHLQRSRLRVEARKWLMGKMNQQMYGDKKEVKHSGSIGTFNIREAVKFGHGDNDQSEV